ncbi:acetylglutamate kinase [Candidatus Woesearchaeota archaeon]|nr:acetylglutamate kinase [Candidatus Woesearchaeota archaeon]
MEKEIEKARVLIDEALPYLQYFKGKTIVIKYGGNAMDGGDSVMKDISFLHTVGIMPIIVHGGGPSATKEIEKQKIKTKFINGLRVTDEKSLKIITKVFNGISLKIKDALSKLKVKSTIIKDAVIAKQKSIELGMVGDITGIKKGKIIDALKKGYVPIIPPLGSGNGKTYNINADTVAVKVAVALKAEKLTMLTNVDGVMNNGKLISHLSIDEAQKHIKNGIITSGMIPKVEACMEAVELGCKKAHLINGTIEHAVLFEIFTESGIGTEIVKNGN